MLKRLLHDQLLSRLIARQPNGIILTGIVGCGKTTLIEGLCEELSAKDFEILRYEGDDVQFRSEIRKNSRFFIESIQERGFKKPFIFVDEVQKEPEIFDAIKLTYDKLKIPFILSGSNPAYLNTEASRRLQRRAAVFSLHPFCLPEILVYEKYFPKIEVSTFTKLLLAPKITSKLELTQYKIPAHLTKVFERFFITGGLPLAYLSKTLTSSFEQIKLTAERGITTTFDKTIPQQDETRQYLAMQNSREFAYQGLFQKLRQNKRHIVNAVIDQLLNHGYLLRRRPFLEEFEYKKRSYQTIYSWIDSGLVSYFQGSQTISDQEKGFRLEAYIHTRLCQQLETIPLKSNIYFYKPFQYKESNDSLLFLLGEIDFVIRIGERTIPIEVKYSASIRDIDTSTIQNYMMNYKKPFGIILYGGAPFKDLDKKLIYYPFWAI